MRTTKMLLALFFASTTILSMSCSKNIDNTHTLEYKIEGFDEFCIQVRYMDADGNIVTTTDPAEFPGGIKTLTVSKPFLGGFELIVDNSSIRNRDYELSIVIDGEPQLSKSMFVPSFESKTHYLEYNFK